MIGGAAPENETHFSTQATEAVNSATVVREFPEADAPTIPTPRKGIVSMISEAPTVDTFVEAEFDLRWPESITHSPECRECFRRILEAAPEILERKVASKRRRDFGLIQL